MFEDISVGLPSPLIPYSLNQHTDYSTVVMVDFTENVRSIYPLITKHDPDRHIVLRNRAFQKVTPGTTDALTPWVPVGKSTISVIADSPAISSALPNALKLVVSAANAGVSNSG